MGALYRETGVPVQVEYRVNLARLPANLPGVARASLRRYVSWDEEARGRLPTIGETVQIHPGTQWFAFAKVAFVTHLSCPVHYKELVFHVDSRQMNFLLKHRSIWEVLEGTSSEQP